MKNRLFPTLMTALTVISADAVPSDLLEKLDADEFSTRSQAQEDLMKWARQAKGGELKELKQAYEQTDSPEVKMRLSDVLDNSTFMALPNTRGFVGITMNPQLGGVGILMVQPDTPAQKVDLREGDSIIEVDGKDMTGMKANPDMAMDFFSDYVKSKNAGQKLELKINRNGRIIEKTLKLGDYDEFNKRLLGEQQQFLLNGNQLLLNGGQLQLNGNQLQIQPNMKMQLKVVPGGVNPKEAVPNPNIEELKKAIERHQLQAAAERNLLQKRKEALRLEIEKLKSEQQK